MFRQVSVNVEAEVLKLNAIAKCGELNGFHAPTARRVDDLTIEMNFVKTSQSSSSIFRKHVCHRSLENRKACRKLVEECGRALASIHGCLNEAYLSFAASPPLTSNQSVLHCDFGFSNIFLNANSELVVFDPFPDFYTTFETWEIGPRSRDLGMFVSCLVGRVPLSDFLRVRVKRIPELIEEFVGHYNAASDEEIDIDDVIVESSKNAKAYFSKSKKITKRQLGSRLWSRNLKTIQKLLELK